MHQSGHGEPASRHGALALGAYRSEPIMPVISGEARYEALEIGRRLDAADARQAFWAHLINGGCAGHTYGANGIWQVNRRDQPYGPSPGGNNWGTTPWDDAMRLPGSSQLAAAKRLLESLPWYKLEPHPEWIAWLASQTELAPPFCAGITDELRLVYLLEPRAVRISALKPGTRYTVEWFNPVDGVRRRAFALAADAQGSAVVTPPTDDPHDWALVLKPEKP
jgi:hypothetical protein